MADFDKAFTYVQKHEGLYSDDSDDSGWETYRGVSRFHNPLWPGWSIIDRLRSNDKFPSILKNNQELNDFVSILFRNNYWDKVVGDKIEDQKVAESIFDFSVNTGARTSILLVQKVVGTKKDGYFGPVTLQAINHPNINIFLQKFTLAKIRKYVKICKKYPKNRKFLYGWVRRAVGRHID